MSDTFLNILENTQLNRSVGKSFAYTDPVDGKVKETPGEMPLPFDKGYPAGIEPGSDAAMEYDVYRSNFTKIPDFSLSDDYIAARRKDKQGTELEDPIWLAASNQLYRHFYNQGGVVAAGMDDPSTLTPREMGEWGAEFMLRFNYNLPYMVFNATAGLDMPPSVASSMYYLMETADREGISGLNFAKGFGYAMLDPTSWVGAATFGIGIAGKMAGKKATKAGFKAMLKSIILAPTSKPAMFEGGLAAVHSATANYIEQDVRVDADKQEKISVPELGASALVGAVAGEEFVRMGSPLGAKVIEKGKEVYKDVKDKVTATISEEDGNVKVEAALDDEEQVAKEMGDKTVESTGPEIDQDKSVGAAGINENMLLTELDKDGFYSQLLAKAKDLSPRLNTANVKATLLNMGVKEDEMRWVGIDDFLEQKLANNNGQDVSFDKLELVDYIRDNQVKITTRKATGKVEAGSISAGNSPEPTTTIMDYHHRNQFEKYMEDNVGKQGVNYPMQRWIEDNIDDVDNVAQEFAAWASRNQGVFFTPNNEEALNNAAVAKYMQQIRETGKEDLNEAMQSIYGEINYQDRPDGYNEMFTRFVYDKGREQYSNMDRDFIISYGAQNEDNPNNFDLDTLILDESTDNHRVFDDISGYYIVGNPEDVYGVYYRGSLNKTATDFLRSDLDSGLISADDQPGLANWLMQYTDDSLAQGDEVFDYGVNHEGFVPTIEESVTGAEPLLLKYTDYIPKYLDDVNVLTLEFKDKDAIAKRSSGGEEFHGASGVRGSHMRVNEFVHVRYGLHKNGVGPNAKHSAVVFEIQSDEAQQTTGKILTKSAKDKYDAANVKFDSAIKEGNYTDPDVKTLFNNKATADVPNTLFDMADSLGFPESQIQQFLTAFVSSEGEPVPFLARVLVANQIKKKHNYIEPPTDNVESVNKKIQYHMGLFDERFDDPQSLTYDNLMDALQDNYEEFFKLLPESVQKLSGDEYITIRNIDDFIVDGKSITSMNKRDALKVSDYVTQYYRKHGKLPNGVTFENDIGAGQPRFESEEKLNAHIDKIMSSSLTSTEKFYIDYFTQAFEEAGTMMEAPNINNAEWKDVFNVDEVVNFSFLKPTLDLIKVKNNIFNNVSKEDVFTMGKGLPRFQEKPFINNVEKTGTAGMKRVLYEIVANDPDEKLTHIVMPTHQYIRTIEGIGLESSTFYDTNIPKILNKTLGTKGDLVPAEEVFDTENPQFIDADIEDVEVRLIELTPELRARIKKGFALFSALPAAMMGKEIITNNQGQDDGNST